MSTVSGSTESVLPGSLTPHVATGMVETGAQLAERMRVRAATGFGPLGVPGAVASLLPTRGLERGAVYRVSGDAHLSLLYALVSVATGTGSWLALVNLPQVGLLSMHESGVALHRTVCVAVGDHSAWVNTVGALVDGFDIVAVSGARCSVSDARRIVARAKAQSAVVVIVGDAGAFSVDYDMSASTTDWCFSTHASSRNVRVAVQGRRLHVQRSCHVSFPGVVSVGAPS